MNWLQPVAWIGLVALALPVLIHLLGLGRARRMPFPTLRFVQSTRLLPTRRTRLHDPWLLVVRALIVLFAVAALAQPLWQTGARRAAYGSSLTRVIVLDTSRSARLAAERSGWSADSARALAAQLTNDVDAAILLETARPDAAVPGAIEWLRLQAQRQELVVLSDFQRSTIDDALWSAIPAEVGVRLLRIGAADARAVDTSAIAVVRSRSGGNNVTVRTSFGNIEELLRTRATWEQAASGSAETALAGETPVLLLAGEEDRAMASEMLNAALRLSERLVDSAAPAATGTARNTTPREVAVITPDYALRTSLLDSVVEVKPVWMTNVLTRVSANILLAEVAASAIPNSSGAPAPAASGNPNPTLIPIVRNDSGSVIVSAAAQSSVGVERLLFFTHDALNHSTTMALLTAAQQAVDASMTTSDVEFANADVAESEVLTIPDSTLSRWQREPSSNSSSALSDRASPLEGPSDARWFWLVVLLLLGVETVMRRRISSAASRLSETPDTTPQEVARRAAMRT